ncbi:MAG: class I SAM-dependent methyltransferase [Candidatus Omnitrophota bacterium]|nr:class I SAM-dependent methyltransferase [Candidatus Omnitrophota bacterium]
MFKIILDQYLDRPIKIFEWGSGCSTIYYSKYLKSKNANFQWHAVDNNKPWYEKVLTDIKKENLISHIHLYLKEFLPFWQKPGWGQIPPPCAVFSPKEDNEWAYIRLPQEMNQKFDIIIIDARFRRHCVQIAKQVLAPGGVVIMHDAHKPHYHQGLEGFPLRSFYDTGSWYPFQERPNQVWVGSMKNQIIFDVLKSFEKAV